MMLERFDEDFFRRQRGVAIALTSTPIAAGQPQINPVGGRIDGADKTLRVHEGL